MEQERHDIGRNEVEFTYWFYSEGPKGKILKAVQFQPKPKVGRNVFNLAFGDWDESRGKIDDRVISNNGDRLKVLRTIVDPQAHARRRLALSILLLRLRYLSFYIFLVILAGGS